MVGMIIADFLALMSTVTGMLSGFFAMIDRVIVISDGTNSLTLLNLFVSIAFVKYTIEFINELKAP
jgi:hypothetical protein